MSEPLPLNVLFADMFHDDCNMAQWLNSNCEYDADEKCWFGWQYFDEDEFDYASFEVVETPDDLFCITMRSHKGVDPLVTESVSEFLVFLDNTDWHSFEVTIEHWLNSRFTVVTANIADGYIWRGSCETDFIVQQNSALYFRINMVQRGEIFVIHHQIKGLKPFLFHRSTTIDEMRSFFDDRLLSLTIDDLYRIKPALRELSELREWLKIHARHQVQHDDEDSQEEPVWYMRHYFTSERVNGEYEIEIKEIVDGFLMTCHELAGTFKPFIATSMETFAEYETIGMGVQSLLLQF
jgi:hypothetical protein